MSILAGQATDICGDKTRKQWDVKLSVEVHSNVIFGERLLSTK
jgi:hypothetical protein